MFHVILIFIFGLFTLLFPLFIILVNVLSIFNVKIEHYMGLKLLLQNKGIIFQYMFLNTLLSGAAYGFSWYDINTLFRCILITAIYLIIFLNLKVLLKRIKYFH